MRVGLLSAPWYEGPPTDELVEACELLGDGLWREAAVRFYAARAARIRRGKSAPKGMQAELNRLISEKFEESGWLGRDGRFVKGTTWVRVTFRHQMSLGSDFIDAAKVCRREGCTQVAILAGDADWLQLVSPNDCKALVSFEKLRIAAAELQGVLEIPLYVGSLRGGSSLPADIEAELRKSRPRDTTVPV